MGFLNCKVMFTVQLLVSAATVQGQFSSAPATAVPPTAAPGCALYWDGPQKASFETSFDDWFQDDFDDAQWTRRSGLTTSPLTGPSSAYNGRYYLYVEASGQNPYKIALLNSPCFDLQSATTAAFSFAYHMYTGFSTIDFGTLDLEASKDEGLTWTSVWSESGNQGNMWHTTSVDLSEYVGFVLRLRFNRVTGDHNFSDAAIDFVSMSIDGEEGAFTAAPTNAPPTAAAPTSVPSTTPPTPPSTFVPLADSAVSRVVEPANMFVLILVLFLL